MKVLFIGTHMKIERHYWEVLKKEKSSSSQPIAEASLEGDAVKV